jgi:3-deoxy-D-manno-octulosonic-acid transferase
MGPHTFNFDEAASLAQDAGAAARYESLDQAVQAAQTLVHDPVRKHVMTQAASRFALAHRGAADRTATAVLELVRE